MVSDTPKLLVAVFASPVADVLLRWGQELGFRVQVLDPDPARGGGIRAFDELDGDPADADVVVTDHHRDELGSKAPPEIALSGLAGLLADRNGRSGGFAHRA